MLSVIQSPQPLLNIKGKSVFLAGTIEDGNSTNWQNVVVDALATWDITILNPRRVEWDASWIQSIQNKVFTEQVEWELAALELADILFFYFAAGSISPISLLELGLHAASGKLVVVCPDGYWKKGNIDIVAKRYNVEVANTLELGLALLQKKLAQ